MWDMDRTAIARLQSMIAKNNEMIDRLVANGLIKSGGDYKIDDYEPDDYDADQDEPDYLCEIHAVVRGTQP